MNSVIAKHWKCDQLCGKPLICACVISKVLCVTKWFFSLFTTRGPWWNWFRVTPGCQVIIHLPAPQTHSISLYCPHCRRRELARRLWEQACLGLCDSRKSFKVSSDCWLVGDHTFLLFDFASLAVLLLFEPLFVLFLILDYSAQPSTEDWCIQFANQLGNKRGWFALGLSIIQWYVIAASLW